jgi:hypothetical protein
MFNGASLSEYTSNDHPYPHSATPNLLAVAVHNLGLECSCRRINSRVDDKDKGAVIGSETVSAKMVYENFNTSA